MDNERLNNVIKVILASLFQMRARLTKKAFYCKALTGQSYYNIVINSDMTVSCNCQDYDGSGHLGDLLANSLQEIFRGPVARGFRKKLAEGKLPILTCTRCGDLQPVDKADARHFEEHYSVPEKGIMVENTVSCNLDCTGCSRKTLLKIRRQRDLTVENIRKISSAISENRIENLYYFNLGEPFLHPDIIDELTLLRNGNPDLKITTSTNGSLLDTDRKREAALLLDHIYFSVDGISDETVRRYQRQGSFRKAYDNMKALVEYRDSRGLRKPLIEWKYVLFNWNDRKDMILKAIDMAGAAGVDTISFWPTKSPVYGISWRYYFGGFFKSIGVGNWKGREVNCPERHLRSQ
ncbi:MAG TPA: hypothetical protein DDW94_06540 [Deltaproteobacteria bacterium]|nr:MAG: hypothetical protein A2Z79_01070 [Deltaproteobacteria bacterium GWA2_55_82]OGQ62113.1 MAG: hypothetical protein A3I81_04135 [Deltaproteobacteria bacterium RIFCSPLOWO2_02_FULL_55_12]OIJ74028.1 MAG: hypothetical protein A2V21_306980 [Deltaproteobacteria bacterium GWC2_55_46]HBG46635.1 hypothetical protein [Deltaproteobacteria bacterium]HCY11357.1 hypothetical protein [Deltaproteobacteria bacterium]